jgi:hypothetical protein
LRVHTTIDNTGRPGCITRTPAAVAVAFDVDE